MSTSFLNETGMDYDNRPPSTVAQTSFRTTTEMLLSSNANQTITCPICQRNLNTVNNIISRNRKCKCEHLKQQTTTFKRGGVISFMNSISNSVGNVNEMETPRYKEYVNDKVALIQRTWKQYKYNKRMNIGSYKGGIIQLRHRSKSVDSIRFIHGNTLMRLYDNKLYQKMTPINIVKVLPQVITKDNNTTFAEFQQKKIASTFKAKSHEQLRQNQINDMRYEIADIWITTEQVHNENAFTINKQPYPEYEIQSLSCEVNIYAPMDYSEGTQTSPRDKYIKNPISNEIEFTIDAVKKNLEYQSNEMFELLKDVLYWNDKVLPQLNDDLKGEICFEGIAKLNFFDIEQNKEGFTIYKEYERKDWNDTVDIEMSECFDLINNKKRVFYGVNSFDNKDYEILIGNNQKDILYQFTKRDVMFIWNKSNEVQTLDTFDEIPQSTINENKEEMDQEELIKEEILLENKEQEMSQQENEEQEIIEQENNDNNNDDIKNNNNDNIKNDDDNNKNEDDTNKIDDDNIELDNNNININNNKIDDDNIELDNNEKDNNDNTEFDNDNNNEIPKLKVTKHKIFKSSKRSSRPEEENEKENEEGDFIIDSIETFTYEPYILIEKNDMSNDENDNLNAYDFIVNRWKTESIHLEDDNINVEIIQTAQNQVSNEIFIPQYCHRHLTPIQESSFSIKLFVSPENQTKQRRNFIKATSVISHLNNFTIPDNNELKETSPISRTKRVIPTAPLESTTKTTLGSNVLQKESDEYIKELKQRLMNSKIQLPPSDNNVTYPTKGGNVKTYNVKTIKKNAGTTSGNNKDLNKSNKQNPVNYTITNPCKNQSAHVSNIVAELEN